MDVNWLRLGLSVFLIFLLLHGSASVLGSLRGEAGVAVGVVVVVASLGAQRALAAAPSRAALRVIGLGRPTGRSIYAGLVIGGVLLLVIPTFAFATNLHMAMYPGWPALLPGLFAQGGVAEEVLFRGFLFGNVRSHRSFWRAAVLSAGPFVVAHLLLFATMSWPVALASTVLAFVVSFPLSRLFELGGRTIWAAALVHFVIQGAIKVIEIPDSPTGYPMVWLVACALAPWLAFAFRLPAASDSTDA
jgi:membrane protease YdiL (CAAX protease family)